MDDLIPEFVTETTEALAVLEAEARGDGFSAFEAGQALERWKEGSWALIYSDRSTR